MRPEREKRLCQIGDSYIRIKYGKTDCDDKAIKNRLDKQSRKALCLELPIDEKVTGYQHKAVDIAKHAQRIVNAGPYLSQMPRDNAEDTQNTEQLKIKIACLPPPI